MPVHPTDRRANPFGTPSVRARPSMRLCGRALLVSSMLGAQPVLSADLDGTGDALGSSEPRPLADGRADYLFGVEGPEASEASSLGSRAAQDDENAPPSGRSSESDRPRSAASPSAASDGEQVDGEPRVNGSCGPDAAAACAPPASGLEPIPLQIINPGVSVSFELVPRDAEDGVSVTVDRLPEGAAMLENADGTHTFRWLTGPDDEGEHVFRFTAVDDDGRTVLGTRDATVVVGDPTLGGSYPAR